MMEGGRGEGRETRRNNTFPEAREHWTSSSRNISSSIRIKSLLGTNRSSIALFEFSFDIGQQRDAV